MRPTSWLPLLAATLCLAAAGCGDREEGRKQHGHQALELPPAVLADIAEQAEPAPAPAVAAEPPIPDGYAAGLRERLRRGEADAVRLASPPGLLAAVGAIRRALARVEPDERAAALAAVSSLAEIAETQTDFLAASEAVRRVDASDVRVPGWAAPVLRAVAAGPASAGDPAALTDADLLDGTVAVLLEDPAFRAGLDAWTVEKDVPAVPPEPEVGEDGVEEDVIGVVELAGPGGGRAVIPVVGSGGRWVPVIVEATLPYWAARADAAGGTGAAAVLAAAEPHLAAAAKADTQAAFDDAVRAATAAALALSGSPARPRAGGRGGGPAAHTPADGPAGGGPAAGSRSRDGRPRPGRVRGRPPDRRPGLAGRRGADRRPRRVGRPRAGSRRGGDRRPHRHGRLRAAEC